MPDKKLHDKTVKENDDLFSKAAHEVDSAISKMTGAIRAGVSAAFSKEVSSPNYTNVVKDTSFHELSPGDEVKFKEDYATYSKKTGMNPNPDDPLHHYDYRGQWKESGLNPNTEGHLSSKYKLEGHPRTYLRINGVLTNTKTGKPVKSKK